MAAVSYDAAWEPGKGASYGDLSSMEVLGMMGAQDSWTIYLDPRESSLILMYNSMGRVIRDGKLCYRSIRRRPLTISLLVTWDLLLLISAVPTSLTGT